MAVTRSSVGQQEEAPNVAGSEPSQSAIKASSNSTSRVRRRGAQGQQKQSGSGASAWRSMKLHSFEALPSYLQDNEFIQTGYRHELPLKDTLRSLFNLHNETGNVWSHLIGFILFAGLTCWMVRAPPTPLALAKPHMEELWHAVQSKLRGSMGEGLNQLSLQQLHLPNLPSLQLLHDTVHSLQGSWQSGVHSLQESVHTLQESTHALAGQLQHRLSTVGDAVLAAAHLTPPKELLSGMTRGLNWPTARWPMYVFCAGAMSCLLLSAVCHLFGCCQRHIAALIWRLDYAGIALLIVSSFYPTVYYAFLCRPAVTAVYLAGITAMGSAAVATSLLERFQRPEWRTTRAGLYVALGLMGVVPLVHIMALHGDVWHVRTFVAMDALMGISYLSGAFIYAMRVPERWFPGKFDMLLHSHQIFHLCVVLGAYLHWRAALLLLEWRDASGGCAMPVMTGPLSRVMEEIAAHGHDLLAIDQVWDGLRAAATEHLRSLLGGVAGLAGAGAGAAELAVNATA